MKWITAAEIDNWTAKEPRRAQEVLPRLVWKLILGSCTRINDHHFPYGKAIQYSGYDGYLDTNDENPFVPFGKSVWEFGTDEDAKGKLNSDYQRQEASSMNMLCMATCGSKADICTWYDGSTAAL